MCTLSHSLVLDNEFVQREVRDPPGVTMALQLTGLLLPALADAGAQILVDVEIFWLSLFGATQDSLLILEAKERQSDGGRTIGD